MPGWDCHGLPIEHQVEKELGERKQEMPLADKRRLCRNYAEKYVEIQRSEFRRLGVLGDWEHPYRTMDFPYEATIVSELGKFAGMGSLYKGLKPVYWCASCQTALAEAEVEYEDHTSPSIYVKFPLVGDSSEILPALAKETVSAIIWTTTPWTLPANLAVAFHPEYDYLAVKVGREVFLLAKALLEQVERKLGWKAPRIVGSFKGKIMEGKKCRHPFLDQESLCILADYVTLDQGTGIVHTAPGHGAEDYESGIKYGLPIYNPVDDRGHFLPEVKFFGGMEVWEANDAITAKLKEDGMLLGVETHRALLSALLALSFSHHLSGHRAMVPFHGARTTFARGRLQQIKEVKWIPPWGEERIFNMIANRPDWCISRQRAWGVPITVFYCRSCGKTLAEKPLFDHVASLMAQSGSDIWFSWKVGGSPAVRDIVVPSARALPSRRRWISWMCGLNPGVSQAAVLETRERVRGGRPTCIWRAATSIGGGFTARCWLAVGTDGSAPYRSVLTHGFVDGWGR